MRDETLCRLSGTAAIVGGLLRAANGFAANILSDDILQLVYFATDVVLIFGLAGIYLQARAQVGWFGFAGFVATVIGLLMVRSGALFGGYQAGASAALLGTVLLGGIMLAKRYSIAAPALWIASFALALAAALKPGMGWTAIIAGAVYGAGFVLAGTKLFGKKLEKVV
ncbi:MAG: hypothetical protein HY243_03585 [Proteobacteria bacterium]|nr:hypothetical protein [Pseudomonadota bacterium]